jgi:hypothetical protein
MLAQDTQIVEDAAFAPSLLYATIAERGEGFVLGIVHEEVAGEVGNAGLRGARTALELAGAGLRVGPLV